MADRQKEVEVYDTPSNLGSSFTVSIVEEIDETTVKVRVWYGRAAINEWETWREWGARCSPRRETASQRSASCRNGDDDKHVDRTSTHLPTELRQSSNAMP